MHIKNFTFFVLFTPIIEEAMQINNYIDTSRNSMLDILFNFLNNSAGKGVNLQVITIYCLCEKLPMFPMKINVIVAVGTIYKDINAI